MCEIVPLPFVPFSKFFPRQDVDTKQRFVELGEGRCRAGYSVGLEAYSEVRANGLMVTKAAAYTGAGFFFSIGAMCYYFKLIDPTMHANLCALLCIAVGYMMFGMLGIAFTDILMRHERVAGKEAQA